MIKPLELNYLPLEARMAAADAALVYANRLSDPYATGWEIGEALDTLQAACYHLVTLQLKKD
jgi:hypothetical protein